MKHSIFLFAAMLAAVGSLPVVYGETQNELLKKALIQERVEGNLPEAIKLYEQVVESGSDRAMAAQALISIGQDYEKLGRVLEARAVYGRIGRDFAAQTASVNRAAARLAQLDSGTDSGPVTRQVWNGAVFEYGTVSQDGHYLPYTDIETGDVVVRDLATGTNRRITAKTGGWNGGPDFAERTLISPDNRQIAFAWQPAGHKAVIHVVSLALTEPSWGQTYGDSPEILYMAPLAWTSDGGNLIVARQQADMTFDYALMSLADGSLRSIRKMVEGSWGNVSLSPDGRWLAFDVGPDQRTHDIHVIGLDGSGETVVVANPANDHNPMWSPDGSQLIFVSDRTRDNSLWSVPMENGKPVRDPVLLKSELGTFLPLGIARNGAIFYTTGGYGGNIAEGLSNVYIAPVSEDFMLDGTPIQASQQFLNSNAYPSWSPDGNYLAYFVQSAPAGSSQPRAVAILSVQDGTERLIPTAIGYNTTHQIQWFPDGKSILVAGGFEGEGGIRRLNVETGEQELVVPRPFGTFSLARDGKTLYYVVPDPSTLAQTIVRRDLETGVVTELKRRSGGDQQPFASLAISPDGEQLAIAIQDYATLGGSVEVVPATGGPSREVFQIESWLGGAPRRGLVWSPDQKYLLFQNGGLTSSTGPGQFIWRVPASGGVPENTGIGIHGVPQTRTAGFPSVDPNGRRVAYYTSDRSISEVFALENVLPPAK